MIRSILVCGSRNWPQDKLWFVTAKMIEAVEEQDECPRIISGGARGVDRWAIEEAERLNWSTHIERADWDAVEGKASSRIRVRPDGSKYDLLAGFDRNLRMLDMGPDLVLAFRWQGSGGTQHTIDNARARGIPVEVFTEDNLVPDIASLDAGDEA